MKRSCTILFTLVLTFTAACSSPTINPNVQSGGVIFQDDFSDNSAEWSDAEDADGATRYDSDAYQIRVDATGYYLWSNPEKVPDMNDVRIDVDVTKVGGPDANDMGIICRYVDDSNFYFFTISSDGYFGISKLISGEETLIGVEELLFNENAIRPGNATNHIRADCVGNNLSLWVNGSMLFEVEDADFGSGNVGLIAGSYEEGGVDLRFDNFSVTRP